MTFCEIIFDHIFTSFFYTNTFVWKPLKWFNSRRLVKFVHSHKKRIDSLETQVISLILLLELEISGVVVQGVYRNSEKWQFSVRNFLMKMTLRLFYQLSVVMTMVSRLLRELRKSLQIKQDCYKYSLCFIICCIAKNSINNSKKGWLLGHLQRNKKSCRSCTKKETITGLYEFYPQWKWVKNLSGKKLDQISKDDIANL